MGILTIIMEYTIKGKLRTGVVSMKFKIKDPGSAITHFIGCVMAIVAAAPLLIKAAREPGSIYMIAMKYDPSLCGKYDLPYCGFYRKG